MRQLCHNIPKAEVHVHLEGSLDIEYMEHLAELHATEVPYEVYSLVRQEVFNLEKFFRVYYKACSLLRTTEDFAGLIERYLKKAGD